jgi:hypothetical protein
MVSFMITKSAAFYSIPREIDQPGEAVGPIDVTFNYVKSEVIRPREAPDGDCQQQHDLQRRVLPDQDGRGEDPRQQEQKPL